MPNRNFFTNEIPSKAINASNNYGIISGTINPADISDGLTERGPGLGKLGSSMPTPLARLFLFSAALREVNTLQAQNAQTGHVGTRNVNGELEPTPYHDLVGELLDMLEFIFKFGNEPEFHVQQWNMDTECRALEASRHVAHKNLASALRSAFEFGVLQNIPIYLFKWNDDVIGGSSPVSLVYTSANLGTVLQEGHLRFTGDAGNRLFAYEATPLHKRSASFQEYLFRLLHTDLPAVGVNIPLAQLSQYIQDSATNYDILGLYNAVLQNPSNYTNVRLLQTRGANVNVAGVQLRVFEHIISVDNSGYILQPTVNYYQHGGANVKTPMILTENGIVGLNYADNRAWNPQSDHIDSALPTDINLRTLPGFGSRMRYPFLTANDFLEEKVIEVSYEINRKKFFTGCAKDITFLLPLKKAFFEYFSPADLYRADGTYTDMLKVEYDENHNKLKIELNLPLVNGNRISLVKTYDTSDTSGEKLNCYDGNNTFDFAVFPFYRLEPDSGHNVYNVMVGRTLQQVDMSFYEPSSAGGTAKVPSRKERRTNEAASLSTDHIRVRGAFSYIELIVPDGQCGSVGALAIPIFTKVDSDRTHAEKDFFFGIDFGTTNTHVTYVGVNPGNGFTLNDIEAFDYNDSDSQMVVFNNEQGTREFGTFTTALNREMVPAEIGQNSVKFPMRTATYQVSGIPLKLEMFFNTNIGFNYGEDISKSKYYKTNIKWDRFDEFANQRMSSFFAQMLWMMKNKSVLNRGSDTFKLVVTYPISMRPGDYRNFLDAWEKAKNEVQCNVEISFRTESVAPYYSYLASLNYGTPYANMDIGGGTTDILYVKPESNETLVCSAFFAANDLWNDGVNAETLKENGFIQYYKAGHGQFLGDRTADVRGVEDYASSSADIISYLFANDSWSGFSNVLKASSKMMQLPVIHFCSLAFYMAYALHLAEVDVPDKLTFTGMGSKYIMLLSSANTDISSLMNAVFHYAGRKDVLNNSNLRNANVSISFAANPKEVTAIGALMSLNYRTHDINPSQEVYYGYENENPERILRYSSITPEIVESVLQLFHKFTGMFNDETVTDVADVLSDLGYGVDNDVVQRLNSYAMDSFNRQKEQTNQNQNPQDRLKEPMFFWPLKHALYKIGKELAQNNNNH